MASIHSRATARLMLSPAVILLLVWMAVPLVMTLWYSLHDYQLLMPRGNPFLGLENYSYFLSDPGFLQSLGNTFMLVMGVLLIIIPHWGQFLALFGLGSERANSFHPSKSVGG